MMIRFKGEMVFVGPRPALYNQDDLMQLRITAGVEKLKPGITGWAQVNGLRGNTSENELMRKRVEYDVWYIENYTFITDIKIILLTVISMVKGDKNAY